MYWFYFLYILKYEKYVMIASYGQNKKKLKEHFFQLYKFSTGIFVVSKLYNLCGTFWQLYDYMIKFGLINFFEISNESLPFIIYK